MATYQTLEEVLRLRPSEVSTLLSEGDPQERVWAGWALGVRNEGIERLESAFLEDDHPGVKRHILLVLVALGKREVLYETARDAFDGPLRATATRYLARLAQPSDDDGYAILQTRALDLSWVVRQCLADALRPDTPPYRMNHFAGLLLDAELVVRETLRRRIEGGVFPRAGFETLLDVLEADERREALERASAPAEPNTNALVLFLRPVEDD